MQTNKQTKQNMKTVTKNEVGIIMLHTLAGKAVSANFPPLVCERLFLKVFNS